MYSCFRPKHNLYDMEKNSVTRATYLKLIEIIDLIQSGLFSYSTYVTKLLCGPRIKKVCKLLYNFNPHSLNANFVLLKNTCFRNDTDGEI